MPPECVCAGASLTATLREDVDRLVVAVERQGHRRASSLARMAFSPRLWAVVNHRVSHYGLTRVRPRALRALFAVLGFVVQRLVRNASGIQIDPLAHIGPGLFFPHEGAIVIGPIRAGRHLTISQGVTVGRAEGDTAPGARDTPDLGDRVWLGPGAVVAGAVDVGSDAVVGANSVVLRDVPACGVVLGVPARLLSHGGSFAKVHYRGMAEDRDRWVAMARAGQPA